MENDQILMKEKLGFHGMLRASLRIITCRNPSSSSFVLVPLLTSLPLFLTMLVHELVFHQTLVQTAKILSEAPAYDSYYYYHYYSWFSMDKFRKLKEQVSHSFIMLGLSYLFVIHVLDLINTITTVHLASMIYAEKNPTNINDAVFKSLSRVKNFKGPLVTSLYVLALSSLTWLGLLSLGLRSYLSTNIVMKGIFGLLFSALLAKYLEWSGVWNTGIVMSILEEDKHGDVALGVSAYVSRGNRRCGIILVVIYFVWKVALRSWSIILHGSGIVGIAIQVGMICAANVIKWVAFMVHFYDCKKRFLEKKIDVEDGTGGASKSVN